MVQLNAIIVMAMYCCGKSFLCENNSTPYKILDLDGELHHRPQVASHDYFKKQKDVDYGKHIEENLHLYDFILLSKFKAMEYIRKRKLNYALVFPSPTLENFNEWHDRNANRNTLWLWDRIKDSFYETIYKMKHDNNTTHKFELNKNQYLSDVIDDIYKSFNKIGN